MEKTVRLDINIDPETKERAEELYREFGITITDAVNMFLRQSLIVGGLPFELRQPRINAETEAAILECEEMLAGGNFTVYENAREMHEAILAEGGDV